MKEYILSFDQGTSSSRCILFNKSGEIVSIAQEELSITFPYEGWVEQDPFSIYKTQLNVAKAVLNKSGISPSSIAGIGIANQRETTVVWNKNTGKPIYNAIVWQCRRTADYCDRLKREGLEEFVSEKTGLVLDPYFSATKIQWILDHVDDAREQANNGELLFGTVDTWLIWNLTKGKVHVTDYTNASRTMLFNIRSLKWDEELLDTFEIPLSMMPEVKSSSEIYGEVHEDLLGVSIPISGICGDQQAALFGQLCVHPGMAKNTYGTGCFILMNTGEKLVASKNGLITTLAATYNNQIQYALEGSIFVGGSVIQWLRDEMGLLSSSAESEDCCLRVKDTNGVFFVPAFTGLGAPYWDPYARGSIYGLTRGTKKEHIVRAAVESIALQSYDVIKAMEKEVGSALDVLRVDGGASANDFLMEFQAGLLNTRVERPKAIETTALGSAYLAGLAVGFWQDLEDIRANTKSVDRFIPNMDNNTRRELISSWHRAINRSLKWSR